MQLFERRLVCVRPRTGRDDGGRNMGNKLSLKI